MMKKHALPLLVISFIFLLLLINNFSPDKFLVGWDNLLPEFDFKTNIGRSIFSGWQEYQGLGLAPGNGHAADIVHQLILLFASLILPLNLLRPFFVFLTLFLGGIGTYFLSSYILNRIQNTEYRIRNTKIPALVAGIFYTLNLGTIQNFYVPFEPFITHFAALPWLLLSALCFIKKQSPRSLIFFIIVNILAIPQGQVPTVFIVYISALLIVLFNVGIRTRQYPASIKVLLITFILNAFWLLPFLFFTLTNAQVVFDAKINQMATENVVLQNKEFGGFVDTMLLKGFWFNNVDPNLNGDFDYMLAPWRNHFSNPYIVLAGLMLFGIMLLGFFSVILNWKLEIARPASLGEAGGNWKFKAAFAALFLFSFTMLATNTFPFSFIDEIFRKIPLFEQVFRFPFTKFSILAALSYSVMLALGISIILKFLDDRIWKIGDGGRSLKIEDRKLNYPLLSIFKKLSSIIYFLPSVVIIAIIFLIALPAFQGHLFYDKSRINIPKEYFDTFEFFKKQDQNTRIANLPQPTFWGWNFYRWGYGGSGFLWYGIKQPILDRAFDVWSQTSENYYYELSSALYSRNPKALQDIFNKYQISFILLDKNIIYPNSPKSLFYAETEELLSKIPNIQGVAQFGNIKIYKLETKDKVNSFIYTKGQLPQIDSPFWKSSDLAYSTFGNYVSVKCQLPALSGVEVSDVSCQMYPFGSLFSLKTEKGKEFTLENQKDFIEVSGDIEVKKDSFLKIPSFFKSQKSIAFEISTILDNDGNTVISAAIKTPGVFLDRQKMWEEAFDFPLFILPKGTKYPVSLNINGVSNLKIDKEAENERQRKGASFLTGLEDNFVVLSGQGISKTQEIKAQIFDNLYRGEVMVPVSLGKHRLSIVVPKIDDDYISYKASIEELNIKDCDFWRSGKNTSDTSNGLVLLTSNNSSICASFYSSSILHDEAYAIFVKSKNFSGRPFHFWVLNEDQWYAPIDTYLARAKNQKSAEEVSFYVLPPMEENGRGYSFHFDNISIGKQTVSNRLSGLEIYPIPFNFITGIGIDSAKPFVKTETEGAKIESVNHPQESFYQVSLSNSEHPTTFILSQSYDPGWRAYSVQSSKLKVKSFLNSAFPFWFGNEIKEHVEVNGWANGWLIEKSKIKNQRSKIIIVFLPQYLEYAGFALLGLFGVIGGIKGITSIRSIK